MAQAAAAGLVISALTTAYSAYDQYQAADEAKDIADKNAKFAKMETEEQVRRLEKTQERQQSKALAAAAASGVDLEGTPALYLQELEDVQQEEVDWLRKTGYRRAAVLKEQGDFAAQRAYQGAFKSTASLFAQAPGIYEAGANPKVNWWT
ncbi:unnamed protein product [marine sediment metagenome]|uniref:Uncharacterized protein n=1 Tax=marine sediment metagenome TaxID=412755 RepID=X1B5M3_9ZZZZ